MSYSYTIQVQSTKLSIPTWSSSFDSWIPSIFLFSSSHRLYTNLRYRKAGNVVAHKMWFTLTLFWHFLIQIYRIILYRIVVGYLKITKDKASNLSLMSTRGSHFYSNTDVTLHDSSVAFCVKHDDRATLQGRTSKSCFNNKMQALVASHFNIQREPVSSASQHQSEVRVRCKTCVLL